MEEGVTHGSTQGIDGDGQPAAIARKAAEREALEAGKREKLASGILGVDMYNMRPALAEKGLVYLDRTVDWYSGADEA